MIAPPRDGAGARAQVARRQPDGSWLRVPNILLIPGTSSEAHLRENVNAANLSLPVHARAALNATGGLT
jgi:aryl-alcohol dehydrogenase-like predicted oxidoreductase